MPVMRPTRTVNKKVKRIKEKKGFLQRIFSFGASTVTPTVPSVSAAEKAIRDNLKKKQKILDLTK